VILVNTSNAQLCGVETNLIPKNEWLLEYETLGSIALVVGQHQTLPVVPRKRFLNGPCENAVMLKVA
jgi:hypothetical protein